MLAKQKIKEATERLGYRAELEKVLPLISQRADLIISDSAGKELAIKFQQSPISIPRLRERNQGYKSIGLSVIWFLGPNYSFTNPSQRLYLNLLIKRRKSITMIKTSMKL